MTTINQMIEETQVLVDRNTALFNRANVLELGLDITEAELVAAEKKKAEKVVPTLKERAEVVGLGAAASEAEVSLAESKLPNANPNVGINVHPYGLEKRALDAGLDYNASEQQVKVAIAASKKE